MLLKHRTNVKIGHINANFIAGVKFHENKTWLLDGRFDILVVSETNGSIQPSLTPNFTSLGLECVERTGPKAAVV